MDETRFTTIDRASVAACLILLADELPPGTHIPVAATRTVSGIIVHFGVDGTDGIDYSVSIDLSTCTMSPLNP